MINTIFSPSTLLRKTSHIFLLALVWVACSHEEQQHANTSEPLSSSPNMIMFLVDDMAWQDTSVPLWTQETPFNKRYHTPNSAIARGGEPHTHNQPLASGKGSISHDLRDGRNRRLSNGASYRWD